MSVSGVCMGVVCEWCLEYEVCVVCVYVCVVYGCAWVFSRIFPVFGNFRGFSRFFPISPDFWALRGKSTWPWTPDFPGFSRFLAVFRVFGGFPGFSRIFPDFPDFPGFLGFSRIFKVSGLPPGFRDFPDFGISGFWVPPPDFKFLAVFPILVLNPDFGISWDFGFFPVLAILGILGKPWKTRFWGPRKTRILGVPKSPRADPCFC